jgi:hypothetical protein
LTKPPISAGPTGWRKPGIHVTYGVVGLKTHSKVILVVRRDFNGLRRYAHIGTGNYHAGTARLYCDLGLLTCDPAIGEDLTELFNYLTTGYVPKRNYRKLLPAPKVLKPALLAKIEREIGHARAGKPALIQFKMNALEDKDITAALVSGLTGRGQGGFDRARYLPVASRHSWTVGDGAGDQHCRPVFGAHPDFLFPQWWQPRSISSARRIA